MTWNTGRLIITVIVLVSAGTALDYRHNGLAATLFVAGAALFARWVYVWWHERISPTTKEDPNA